jgi:hypothetical protein
VLKATQFPGALSDSASVSTATGIHLYVLMAGVLFVLAAVPAIILARNRRAAPPSAANPEGKSLVVSS